MAYKHAVWRVESCAPLERALWNESDEQAWLSSGMPDPWADGPYRMEVQHVGGVRQANLREGRGALTVHLPYSRSGQWVPTSRSWHVYPTERWPQCSCCGEPMPCQAELLDRQVDAGMAKLDAHAAKMPGCCWCCGEPITARQRSVVYAGTNLDLPSGPEVRFHTRRGCARVAAEYEERWRAQEAGRPRYLTWPRCPGTLLTHQDRSQECVGGGLDTCRGHTHTHGIMSACVAQTHGCPRECTRAGHPGALGPVGPKAMA
jgi:hypothetical protein